jgi:hypothetical protein
MARAIGTTAAVVCVILVATGCAGSGGKQAMHSTTRPATPPCSGCIDTSPTGAALNLARSSSPLFSIFPATPGKKPCWIPAGGPPLLHLHGTCRTVVRRAATHEPAFVVSFTETWMPKSHCRPFCPVIIRQYHTWSVVERALPGAGLHIAATRQTGNAAPQFYD